MPATSLAGRARLPDPKPETSIGGWRRCHGRPRGAPPESVPVDDTQLRVRLQEKFRLTAENLRQPAAASLPIPPPPPEFPPKIPEIVAGHRSRHRFSDRTPNPSREWGVARNDRAVP